MKQIAKPYNVYNLSRIYKLVIDPSSYMLLSRYLRLHVNLYSSVTKDKLVVIVSRLQNQQPDYQP